MAEIICKKCGQIMVFKEGISKKSGKPYKMWKCTDMKCDNVEFVHSDIKPSEKPEMMTALETQRFQGTKKEEPKPIPPTYSGLTKAEWATKDASIAALALCKVKAIAGGYNKDVNDITEDIYKDYIKLLNRLSPLPKDRESF